MVVVLVVAVTVVAVVVCFLVPEL